MKPLLEFGVGADANLGHQGGVTERRVGVHEEILEPLTPILSRPAIRTTDMRVCHCLGSV